MASVSASTPKKPPVPTTHAAGRLPQTPTTGTPGPTSALTSRPTSPISATSSEFTEFQRTARSTRSTNGAPMSARSAVKKHSMSSMATLRSSHSEDEAGASTVMADLKERLEEAELTIQEVKRQNEVLQARFDDATKDQAEMEEKLHEEEEKQEQLNNEKRELFKQKRELENIYEEERAAFMKDRDAANSREEELQNVIQRLKDSLSQKDAPRYGAALDPDPQRNGSHTGSSSPTLDANHFAPSLNRSNSSRNNSKLLLQKDKVIEELRLELAEYQIKIMELDNNGGDRTHVLEKSLIDARVTNARLMEENESFQSLLMERTMNGEFLQKRMSDQDRQPSNSGFGGASLADELASISDVDEEQGGDHEKIRKMELEIEKQKAENKTLTLYINKIIERILQHQGGFENILNTAEDDEASGAVAANKNKNLPPPPPTKDEEKPKHEVEPQGFLQRAKSIAYGSGKPKPRPQSVIAPMKTTPSVTEDPEKAPRVPFGRAQQQRHSMALPRRAQTTGDYNPSAAAVVNNMYKGDSESGPRTTSPGLNSPRASYFFSGRVPSNTRPPTAPAMDLERRISSSAASEEDSELARKQALDALTGDSPDSSIDTPSPPRSLSSKDDGRQVLHGKQMRPLRLVAAEEKKNNRASWYSNNVTNTVSNWFNASPAGAQQQQQVQAPTSNPV